MSSLLDSAAHRLRIDDLCTRLKWGEVFGNSRAVQLDLGAGDGGFALAYAARHPGINLLAVERLLGRVRKIEKRAGRQKTDNLRVLRLELNYTVRHLLPAGGVQIAHILFPDPWPKRRHWPRRLLQKEFALDLAAALQPAGELRFTTDDEPYFRAAEEAVTAVPALTRADEWPWREDPPTDFQQTFETQGRRIWRARWIKG